MSLDTVKQAPTKVYFIAPTDLANEDQINLKVSVSGLRSQLEKVWNLYLSLVAENKDLKAQIKTLKAALNEEV